MKPIFFIFLLFTWRTSIAQISKEYYDNGLVRAEGKLIVGEKSGEWRFYYPNGVIQAIENYSNNNLSGTVKSFDFDGNIQSLEIWINGSLEDSAFYYHPNKVLKRKGI